MKGPLDAMRRRRTESPADAADAAEAPTTAQPAATPDGASQPAASEVAASGSATRLWGTGSASAGETAAGEAAPAAGEQAPAAPATDATATQPPPATVPAGEEPPSGRASFRERGRLRRRLRYLRRVRELGFRDLGGLVFDQHRFANVNEELVRGKLAALASIDTELRALEHALDDRRPITELREPGISVCPRCGGLHGSEARYCPSCGVAFKGALAIAEVGEAVMLPGGEIAHVPTPTQSEPAPTTSQPTEAMDAVTPDRTEP